MLRFILWLSYQQGFSAGISIHPMLRFIQESNKQPFQLKRFQYIPCYGLSKFSPASDVSFPHFNTSHVTVYHLEQTRLYFAYKDFNTSHVTVYQGSTALRLAGKTFQYIPCYGLSGRPRKAVYEPEISIHPMLRFITARWRNCRNRRKFQYIPCYGLSGNGGGYPPPCFSFQYIPCYGLSTQYTSDKNFE